MSFTGPIPFWNSSETYIPKENLPFLTYYTTAQNMLSVCEKPETSPIFLFQKKWSHRVLWFIHAEHWLFLSSTAAILCCPHLGKSIIQTGWASHPPPGPLLFLGLFPHLLISPLAVDSITCCPPSTSWHFPDQRVTCSLAHDLPSWELGTFPPPLWFMCITSLPLKAVTWVTHQPESWPARPGLLSHIYVFYLCRDRNRSAARDVHLSEMATRYLTTTDGNIGETGTVRPRYLANMYPVILRSSDV